MRKSKTFGARIPWNSEEDEALKAAVEVLGPAKWIQVANFIAKRYGIKHRTGKQIRERWHNHLDPDIDKHPWTLEEEEVLFQDRCELGNKWADIAKRIPGRTDNNIKNHYYSTIRKQYRKDKGAPESKDDLHRVENRLALKFLFSIRSKLQRKLRRARLEQAEQSNKRLQWSFPEAESEVQPLPGFKDVLKRMKSLSPGWCPEVRTEWIRLRSEVVEERKQVDGGPGD